MARSERKARFALGIGLALVVALGLACNSIIGLSDFEKGECAGRRCGDGGVQPVDDAPSDVVRDVVPDVRGTEPVSWPQWKMPNYDAGPEVPYKLSYEIVDADRIIDVHTGLVWRRATLGRQFSAAGAKAECANLGGGAWRVPKRIELVTLLDFAGTDTLIDARFTGVKKVRVWTSSEVRPFAVQAAAYWTVDFGTGVVDALPASPNDVADVLCVSAKR